MSSHQKHDDVLRRERRLIEESRPKDAPWIGLCLSGGGIRSASFAIGALQGLARLGFLENIDYLSTVSGGGYAGAWLSAWIAREGKERVFEQLSSATEEADPVRHLRLHSTY